MRYFASLSRTSFRPHNLGILFFMLLNSAVLFYAITAFVPLNYYGWNKAEILIPVFLLFCIVYYAIVLSIGSVVIRFLFGNNRILLDNEMGTLQVSFAEAYTAAKQLDPDLSDDIRLYVCSVNYPDAYAFGRDLILISEPASRLSQNQLRVLMMEKFAQLSNHDSERLLLLIAGNAFFIITIFLIKIFVYIALAIIGFFMSVFRMVLGIFTGHVGHGIGFLGISAYLNVSRVLSNAIESVLLFLLNLLIRLVLLTSQSNFFINDQFVCACGYTNDLRYYLQYVEPDISGFNSTLATITASKPSRLARLSRIQTIAPTNPESPQSSIWNLLEPRVITPPRTGEQNHIEGFRVISRDSTTQELQQQNQENIHFRVVSRDDEEVIQ